MSNDNAKGLQADIQALRRRCDVLDTWRRTLTSALLLETAIMALLAIILTGNL